jgi:hypothetical protein
MSSLSGRKNGDAANRLRMSSCSPKLRRKTTQLREISRRGRADQFIRDRRYAMRVRSPAGKRERFGELLETSKGETHMAPRVLKSIHPRIIRIINNKTKSS